MKTKSVFSGKLPRRETGTPKYRYDFRETGVTQSMILLWLACRHQCWLQYVQGWTGRETPLPLAYGSAMHWCLSQLYANALSGLDPAVFSLNAVRRYRGLWEEENTRPTQAARAQQELVYGMILAVLPEYIRRVSRKDPLYDDFRRRKWVHLEQNFRIPWFTDDFKTHLNGRFDGVYEEKGKLWLFESKNLSRIDEEVIQDCLPDDFQTNFYLTALRSKFPDAKIGGVMYNVQRRPGLRQKKTESMKDFLERIREDVMDRPDHYFMRWQVGVSHAEIDEWRDRTLRPILRDMQRWWNGFGRILPNPRLPVGTGDVPATVALNPEHYANPNARVTKYGLCSMYAPMVRNDWLGVYRREVPFSELEE